MAAGSLEEVLGFLGTAERQGFLNGNTAGARRTACAKLFSILEPEQKTVEYVSGHLDLIKSRFQNLNPEVRGGTVEEYARRVQIVLNDYESWTTDRAAWERQALARGRSSAAGDEKRQRPRLPKVPGDKPNIINPFDESEGVRTLSFPMRPNFEVKVTLPSDLLTTAELRRLMLFLLPYVSDFDAEITSPRGLLQIIDPGSGTT